MTIYCNPGNGWAACEAQRWNCAPELIEATLEAAKTAERDSYQVARHYHDALKGRGLQHAAYCESCGRLAQSEATS